MNFVNKDNTKARPDDKYSKVIDDIHNKGVCPFCSEHLETFHKKTLSKGKYWWITDNMYPYTPTKHHRLLIHIEHIVHISEISSGAWKELQEIIQKETDDLEISGGSFILRFGETKYTGASVSHLHAHIVQSDPDSPQYTKDKGLTMRIG